MVRLRVFPGKLRLATCVVICKPVPQPSSSHYTLRFQLALALLLHLCLFHVYINYVGVTTYEYVRAQRAETERRAREGAEVEAAARKAAANRAAMNGAAAAASDLVDVKASRCSCCLPSQCCSGDQVRPMKSHPEGAFINAGSTLFLL